MNSMRGSCEGHQLLGRCTGLCEKLWQVLCACREAVPEVGCLMCIQD